MEIPEEDPSEQSFAVMGIFFYAQCFLPKGKDFPEVLELLNVICLIKNPILYPFLQLQLPPEEQPGRRQDL